MGLFASFISCKGNVSQTDKPQPVNLILDTDLGPDYGTENYDVQHFVIYNLTIYYLPFKLVPDVYKRQECFGATASEWCLVLAPSAWIKRIYCDSIKQQESN